jgi:hypothetical protein
LHFPAFDAIEPAAIAVGLSGAAVFYYHRDVPQFVAGLIGLALITTFSACYSVLMYAEAALAMPLADSGLQAFDASCGVSLPRIVAWAAEHPDFATGLKWAYDSLLWQTPAVIAFLSFTDRQRELRGFITQFMVAALLCAVIFAALPAAGPFASYGYPADSSQARFLEHFNMLRDGSRTLISWRAAEGLITFPSFHTTWAILLAWSLRTSHGLRGPAGLLNAAVILSTMTTGWHYFADVLGGVATAIAAIRLESVVCRWCEAGNETPDSRSGAPGMDLRQ